jgi:hypothetical protein
MQVAGKKGQKPDLNCYLIFDLNIQVSLVVLQAVIPFQWLILLF